MLPADVITTHLGRKRHLCVGPTHYRCVVARGGQAGTRRRKSRPAWKPDATPPSEPWSKPANAPWIQFPVQNARLYSYNVLIAPQVVGSVPELHSHPTPKAPITPPQP